jgi:hypothetical protein
MSRRAAAARFGLARFDGDRSGAPMEGDRLLRGPSAGRRQALARIEAGAAQMLALIDTARAGRCPQVA